MRCLVLLAAIAASLSASPAGGAGGLVTDGNLLVNPSFELASKGWTYLSDGCEHTGVTNAWAASGGWSATLGRASWTSEGRCAIYQGVAAVPLATYTASVRVMVPEPADSLPRLFIMWPDHTGIFSEAPGTRYSAPAEAPGVGEHTLVTSGQAPLGTGATLTARLVVETGRDHPSVVLVDDAVLRLGDP